jgi:hypothetical protein
MDDDEGAEHCDNPKELEAYYRKVLNPTYDEHENQVLNIFDNGKPPTKGVVLD